nr:hypothetical protein [Segatella albensis]
MKKVIMLREKEAHKIQEVTDIIKALLGVVEKQFMILILLVLVAAAGMVVEVALILILVLVAVQDILVVYQMP